MEDREIIQSQEVFTNLKVLDLSGNTLVRKEFGGVNQTMLILSELSSGIYFVEVIGAKGAQIQQLVVH